MQKLYLMAGPLLRAGVALHLAVEREHQLRKAAVVPAGAHGVRQERKARMGLRFFIAGVQHPLQGGPLHGGGAVLIRDFKIRGQAQKVTVFSQHLGTEAVYGADLRLLAQGALPPQAPAARILCQSRGQLLHNSAPKLPGGRPGKGDDQKTVQIGRVLRVRDIGHEPFGQHLGLAAARACRYQHRAASCMDGGVLRRGWSEVTHGLCPPPAYPTPCPG